jgi:hypothetical protein
MDAEFSRRMQQVESLVLELERAPDPRLVGRAQELVRALLDLHKAGLTSMLDMIRNSSDGDRIVGELAADDLVANVLLLHDLHPIPVATRVRSALERVQAGAAKHGAEVVLLENEGGRARIRIAAGSGCGSSADSIRQMVEEALVADAPDLSGLEFETAAPPPAQAFVSLQQLKSHRPSATHPPSEAVAAPPR